LRVHFFAIDHPIVGDSKYTNKREILQNKKINATRPFLHAAKMEFIDRQEHRQTFESKLPEELETILTKIK
jgi:23S rRNA-/tRNA-specific pseudouridylate synthase